MSSAALPAWAPKSATPAAAFFPPAPPPPIFSTAEARRSSVTSLATPLPPTLPISTSSATLKSLSYIRT